MSSAQALPFDPTISRPITLRLRADLSARRHTYQGQTYWVIKEPVGLNYFRFPEESYFVMNLLDGSRSLEQIQQEYNERFSPKKLPLEKLQNFIGSLHRAGLLQSASSGQASELLKRRKKTRRQKLFSKFGNVLAIRFRGIDPERMLTAIVPYTSWMFSKPAVMISMTMAVAALLSILINWDQFLTRLPTFNQFFDPVSWISLAIVLALTKVLHEFGHGITCKRFGGECHEMGFMLLVFTPCLYCNVSDSWTLKSKWQRAAIGAAGIYVEVTLAAIATFVWWNTAPGLLNQISLQVMTICSVSTILFNGNPLLRFDGYYITSDILEIPNLQQKSTQALTGFLKKHLLGFKHVQTPMMPTRNKPMFIAYALASIAYRWFIVIAILMFLNRVFEPYGLQVIGQMIAVMSIGTLVGFPLYKFIKFLRNPSMRYQIRVRRALSILGIVAVIVIGAVSIPLPYYVYCDFTVRSRDSETIYVQTPGEVKSIQVVPGQSVDEEQVVIELENLEVERQLAEINGSISEKLNQVTALKTQSLRDNSTAHSELASVEAELDTLKELRQKTRQKIDQLILRAPRHGTLLPVASVSGTNQNASAQGPLRVFDQENSNAYLPVGVPIGAVGDPNQLEAVMSIPEDRVTFVKPKLEAELKPYAFAFKSLPTVIHSIGRLAVNPPQQESELGPVAGAAVGSPQNLYFAIAALEEDNPLGLKVGSQGKARIRCGNRSLASRISRWAADTFRFQ